MPQAHHPSRMDGEVAGRQPELEAGGVQDPLGAVGVLGRAGVAEERPASLRGVSSSPWA